jgi:hypothetical protein
MIASFIGKAAMSGPNIGNFKCYFPGKLYTIGKTINVASGRGDSME